MTREARPETREPRAERQKRIPLGVVQLRMQAEENPGFQRRWINDIGNRLQRAQQAGYNFVAPPGKKNLRTSMPVGGIGDRGEPKKAYLMEIPQEFYDEDQAAKEKTVAVTDNAIHRGLVAKSDPRDRSNFYRPPEGITVEQGFLKPGETIEDQGLAFEG